MRKPQVLSNHPAESGSIVAGAAVSVIVWAFGLEPPPLVIGAMITLVSVIPAGITWLVEALRRPAAGP